MNDFVSIEDMASISRIVIGQNKEIPLLIDLTVLCL